MNRLFNADFGNKIISILVLYVSINIYIARLRREREFKSKIYFKKKKKNHFTIFNSIRCTTSIYSKCISPS